MALHETLWELAEEAIAEYLLTARLGLDYHKADGGCLGYPSTLLLLSIINALGTYLKNDSVVISGKQQQIKRGEPFRVLNHPLFGQSLSLHEIKVIEHSYRNLLSHNAMMSSGCFLIPGKATKPFEFRGEQVGIYVESFYELVSAAWLNFDKNRIKLAVENGHFGRSIAKEPLR